MSTKGSIDYAQKYFNQANNTAKQAVEMESSDINKAIQLYQNAIQLFHNVRCQSTATYEQKASSETMIARCNKRVSELGQFLSMNPNLIQTNTPQKVGKISSSTNITTPSPTSHQRVQINADGKTKSSNHISKPGVPPSQNLYSTQQPNANTSFQHAQQNIYQTQVQTQPSPIQQSIYQTQNITATQQIATPQQQIATPQQQNQQSDQSTNNYQEAYNFLENGLMMDDDGFYDLAKYFYVKSISLFEQYFLTNQQNQNNINFWVYQLKQRKTALDFFKSVESPDAPSYYFNASFYKLGEEKSPQSTSDSISLLKKCIITSHDANLSNLASELIKNKMASNTQDIKNDNFHANCIEQVYPDHANIFASEQLKNQIKSISTDSSKKFILVFGPPGTKITNLIKYAAISSSVKVIFEVNFMKFIGINSNPVDSIKTAIECAKQQKPSYLVLTHIDACLKEDAQNDNLSKMICDFLISNISSGIEGVTVFCTTELPWAITSTSIYSRFNAKIYYPAPDEPLIKEMLKNNAITKRISDDKIASMASELVGYTEFGIQRILIEAQISNAIRSSGVLRENILSDIAEGLVLRNEIALEDIQQAKNLIPPIVSQSDLIIFDQILI